MNLKKGLSCYANRTLFVIRYEERRIKAADELRETVMYGTR